MTTNDSRFRPYGDHLCHFWREISSVTLRTSSARLLWLIPQTCGCVIQDGVGFKAVLHHDSGTGGKSTLSSNNSATSAASPSYIYNLRAVIAASSAGTMIEWYDFYLYGTLAVFFSRLFFPTGNPTTGFLASLATFGAGFAVRPFGAVFFGRVGDLVGRKYAFLVTLTIMGASTFGVGLLPTYETIGIAAPIILVLLRLLQGLALGGEYGGAATYVAEHAPDHRRGYYTSFIQTTATLGFFLALGVVLVTRLSLGDAKFTQWGWRIPFLISAVLLGLSFYIRIRLKESPLFARLKEQGKSSTTPIKDS